MYEQTTAKLAQWFSRVTTYVHGRKLDQVVSKDDNILPWWRLPILQAQTWLRTKAKTKLVSMILNFGLVRTYISLLS